MKATLWLGASALAAALAAGPALAAGDSAKQGMHRQGASAGASSGQMQHDKASIREAQERLNQLGYDAGEPDGLMGPQTQAALRKYQQEEGLSSSGQLDTQTTAKLGMGGAGGAGTAAGASTPSAGGSSLSGSGSPSSGGSGSPAMGGSTSGPGAPSMGGSGSAGSGSAPGGSSGAGGGGASN